MTDHELIAVLALAILDPVGSCHGDVNGDRRVDATDLSTLLANYGKDPARWTEGDVNDDGRVDGSDLGIVLATWGCREF